MGMQPVEPAVSKMLWNCSCGYALEAVRLPAVGRGGRLMTAFFAREATDSIPAGRRITRCPRCAKRFPWMSWEAFLEHCAAGWP